MSPSENIWNHPSRVYALDRWEEQSRALGQQVTDAIVAAAAPRAGEAVLDVACGTGEPSLTLARMVGASGHVIGTDISSRPLENARERATRQNLSNVDFREADVHHLPFAEACFDLVTSRLGVMFFADLDKAMSELHRVLKPQGRMALLAWGHYKDQDYFRAITEPVMQMLGAEFPAATRTMFKFGDTERLREALLRAGFKDAIVESHPVPYVWHGTAEELWAYFQQLALPWKPLLEQIPEARRAEIEAAVFASLNRRRVEDRLELRATITLATAHK
jgi:ubiquinone/menaquinone biosynthesis C-methylase UbiE